MHHINTEGTINNRIAKPPTQTPPKIDITKQGKIWCLGGKSFLPGARVLEGRGCATIEMWSCALRDTSFGEGGKLGDRSR
eukprot:4751557-Amphidinium_carterae.1